MSTLYHIQLEKEKFRSLGEALKFELNDFTIFYNALKSSYPTNLHHGPFEHWALFASKILGSTNIL